MSRSAPAEWSGGSNHCTTASPGIFLSASRLNKHCARARSDSVCWSSRLLMPSSSSTKGAGFVDVNHMACEILGYSRPELLGMRVVDVEQEFDQEGVEELLSRIESGRALTARACSAQGRHVFSGGSPPQPLHHPGAATVPRPGVRHHRAPDPRAGIGADEPALCHPERGQPDHPARHDARGSIPGNLPDHRRARRLQGCLGGLARPRDARRRAERQRR